MYDDDTYDAYDPFHRDRRVIYEFDPYEDADEGELPAGVYYYPRWQQEDEEERPTWTVWRIILLLIAILIVLSFIGYELLPFIDPAFNTSPPPPPSTPIPRV